MNDFEYISEWLTDAYNNHKELKGYALYHNLNGFIHDAFVEHTIGEIWWVIKDSTRNYEA